VILLDLVVENKKILAGISVVALAIPIAFIVALWGEHQSTLGGMLVVDEFSLFFKFLLVGIAVLVIVSSVDYVKKFARFQGEYYALVLFSAAGLMLMAGTGELISIYVALELSSLSLYALVAFLKDPKSSEAGLKYMILGCLRAYGNHPSRPDSG
jgi:NADH-quinone oxidoreductase subunit N